MGVNEGLWSVKFPNGDVRSGTIDQLNEALLAGHIGESTLVRASGSQDWVTLGDLRRGEVPRAPVVASVHPASIPPASVPPPALEVARDDDVLQVRLASGEVRSGTRRQLREAFQAGYLGGGALVLAPGRREWVPVASVLGQANSVAPPPAAAPVIAMAPASLSTAPAAPSAPSPQVAPQRASVPAPLPPQPAAQSIPLAGDVWQVRLASGEVRSGTRQQLLEAFTAGHLDANVLVLAAGAQEWMPLRSLMESAIPAPAAAAPAAPLAVPFGVGQASAPDAPAIAPAPAPPVTHEAPLPTAPLEPAEAAPSTDVAAPMAFAPSPSEQALTSEPVVYTDRTQELPQETGNGEPAASEEMWQLKLPRSVIEDAFRAGQLSGEYWVLVAQAQDWVQLATVIQPIASSTATNPFPAADSPVGSSVAAMAAGTSLSAQKGEALQTGE